jgi:hypothetical protein
LRTAGMAKKAIARHRGGPSSWSQRAAPAPEASRPATERAPPSKVTSSRGSSDETPARGELVVTSECAESTVHVISEASQAPHAWQGRTRQYAEGRSTTLGGGTQRGPGRSQPAAWAEARQVRRHASAATRPVVTGRSRMAVLPALLLPCRAGSADAQTVAVMSGPSHEWQPHGVRLHVSYIPTELWGQCLCPARGRWTLAAASGASASDSESADSASVAASEAEGSIAWAKCRATAREVPAEPRPQPAAVGDAPRGWRAGKTSGAEGRPVCPRPSEARGE